MSFVAALNAVWIVLGAFALATSAHAVFSRRNTEQKAPSWLLVVGVGLIVAALFPYISATDDILRIDHDQTKHSPEHGPRQQTDNLMRLYEAIDSSLVCRIQPFVASFTFLALVISLAVAYVVCTAPSTAGRSPPPFLTHSLA